MTRVSASLIASAALLAIAACSDSTKNVTGPEVPQQPSLNIETNHGHIHIMPTRAADAAAFGQAGGARTTNSGIVYHGGPILYTTNVAAVYWASSPIFTGGPAVPSSNTAGNSGDASLVGDFLRGLGGSQYFNINTTYYDATNAHVQNVVTYTQYWANGTNVPASGASVSDSQMLSMLQSGFADGSLKYDRNTLYAIFTAGKVNLGGGFGTQYCAYHGSGTITVNGAAVTVLYAAMPYDYAYSSSCTSGYKSPNADLGANYEVNTLAHEIEETTTDQLGNAWFDRRGYENADKCAWTWGTTYTTANGGVANMKIGASDFLVQQNWKNSGSGGCALHL
ncbi:MAG TPA: hypothetical protein VGD02_11310 [Gemmatimonadaceae bacterium]